MDQIEIVSSKQVSYSKAAKLIEKFVEKEEARQEKLTEGLMEDISIDNDVIHQISLIGKELNEINED